MKELDFSRFAPDLTPSSDWGKCMVDFLNQIYRKSSSPHSQDHYRAGMEAFFSIFPRKLPHEYTKGEVIAWITSPSTANGREGRPVKPQTFSNRLIILTGLYKYAQSYGVMGEDGHQYPLMMYLPPTAGIQHPKRPDAGNKALSEEELTAFFKQIPRDTLLGKRDFALMSMYFWCARRRSEIMNLQWRDIEQSLIVDGGQSRMAMIYHFRGKGRKMVDDVYELPPVAATALFAYLEESGLMKSIQPDDYLFTCVPGYIGKRGYDPKRPLSPQSIQEVVKRYASAASINRPIGTHAFRHTSARAAYAAGASVREVQQKLRHRSIATTSLYLETLISVSDPTIGRLQAKYSTL